jgi:hypothetical protein
MTSTQTAINAAVTAAGATLTQQINAIIASINDGAGKAQTIAQLKTVLHTTNNNLMRVQLAAYNPEAYAAAEAQQTSEEESVSP